MSFTSDIKKEIIGGGFSRADKKDLAVNRAGLSAFVGTSGTLGIVEGKANFFLVSETEKVAEFFMHLFSETFSTELFVSHATTDKKRGRDKLVLQCPPAHAEQILADLGLLTREKTQCKSGISARLIKTEAQKIAYVQGAFLGGGSCTLPSDTGTGYHLETVFSQRKTATDFCRLLENFELIAKLVRRKETYVAYIKSKEAISDFLALVGAESALKKFNAFVEKRDEANRDNRAKNCISGNADKTAIAAVKQVVAIQKLKEKTRFAGLSDELSALARARLQFPTMSLRELAEYLHTSKSCLNHRMRRLMELSEEL